MWLAFGWQVKTTRKMNPINPKGGQVDASGADAEIHPQVFSRSGETSTAGNSEGSRADRFAVNICKDLNIVYMVYINIWYMVYIYIYVIYN